MKWTKKDLLGIAELTKEEILFVLNIAESLKEASRKDTKKVPSFRGKKVLTLFCEPSRQTKASFEEAARKFSADTIDISVSTSGYSTDDTVNDTAKKLEAMKPDVTVIRHGMAGIPHRLARMVGSSVINGGDGGHEHPTQALLNIFTIKEKKARIDNLKIVMVGGFINNRAARSCMFAFRHFDSEIICCGPPTMLPRHMEDLGAKVEYNLKKATRNADVVMVFQAQTERGGVPCVPSMKEYSTFFGLGKIHLHSARKDVIVLHPGPVNWGIEILDDIADGPYPIICEQTENGAAVSMAILSLLLGRKT